MRRLLPNFAWPMFAGLLLLGCQSVPPGAPAEKPVAAEKTATVPPAPTHPQKKGAPLFSHLGSYQRDVTTSNEQARRYFNQGLILTYGFNHEEAGRSFKEAARLDPSCAACWWGVAIVLGPNINLPMLPPAAAPAYEAVRKAASLAGGASPVEKALIGALVKRYAEKPPENRAALDLAYANAMREVAAQYPQDPDVLALFAESLLDLSPWNYWQPDGSPKDFTAEAIKTIETAMALSPAHPGALHYYIHVLEEVQPDRATAAADTLRDLVPDAGHLVHMPGHIYIRTGRYQDALDVNVKAGEADQSYITQCNVQGFYPLAYHPHNWHFVWAAATFAGNQEDALIGANKVQHLMHGNSESDPMLGPIIQHFALTPLYANVRFGLWDQVLATPAPAGAYMQAIWHYARGFAYAARNDMPRAENELVELQRLVAEPELAKMSVSARNTADKLVLIAEKMLMGNIEARKRNFPVAIAALNEGVKIEDSLGYAEPEDWHYPVRLYLGAVLLDAGKPAEAEAVYRDDLKKHRENGWALFGLAQALDAQSKRTDGSEARARFETAWRGADISLTSSVIR
jgi:tetratricopeptide (TPR) repeat protein